MTEERTPFELWVLIDTINDTYWCYRTKESAEAADPCGRVIVPTRMIEATPLTDAAGDLVAALKGARDCLSSIPEGKRGNHDANINRQLVRIEAVLAKAGKP